MTLTGSLIKLATMTAILACFWVTISSDELRHNVSADTQAELQMRELDADQNLSGYTQNLESETRQLEELPSELITKELDEVPDKLFDYEHYKRLFNKHYNSIAEELSHRSIFIARSIRAYISGIKYKFRIINYFYSVNFMSDWTQTEINRSESSPIDPMKAPGGENIHILTLEDYMEWKKDDEKVGKGREKRSAETNPRDDFFMDELLESQVNATESPEVAAKMVDDPYKLEDESKTNLDTEGGFWNPASWRRYWFGEAKSVKQQKPSSGRSIFRQMYRRPFKFNLRRRTEQVTYVDHRRSNCFHVAQNQGSCGGCYAFATIAFYEWAFCKETGQLPKFSEQYVIDCGPVLEELEGCKQGIANTANLFTHRYGLELANYYPYKGVSGRCPYNLAIAMPQEMGYIRVDTLNVAAVPINLVDHFLPFAPMQMNIDSRGGYREYGGGVHDGVNCGKLGTHSVLLVGSGRQDGLDYWLFRNSHSPAYGEDGYYKLDKRSDCIHPRYGFVFGTRDGKRVSLFARQNPLRDFNVIHAIQDTRRYIQPFDIRETFMSGHSEHRLSDESDNLRISYFDN